ncbi:hypothetical protein RND71_019550 [Anisodus tanguticus]|uniref:Uncharacterized protein n=1 Tax=Anisodus tanguticus TaxID=243964 RepID=A0AAE1RZ75_9SOLA|nr:hypothetical protein RND71_019550 [Anisodus tanguticus]
MYRLLEGLVLSIIVYEEYQNLILKNKISIINAGALEPIICFLRSENSTLQDHATASLLTLSASSVTKPIISASGIIPRLVEVPRQGSSQAKVDAGRTALTSEEGGILAIVEVLESGSLQSREHAVGALLTMCQSDRRKYREPILKEGIIPGLFELTVQGTPKSQSKAQTLLRFLRDTPYPNSELEPDTLENIVSKQFGKTKEMLAEMISFLSSPAATVSKWAIDLLYLEKSDDTAECQSRSF